MIQLSSITVENIVNQDWKAQLQASKMSTQELLALLRIENHPLAQSEAEKLFALRVPPLYLSQIQPNTPNDPLLLQVLPQSAEFLEAMDYCADPLNEAQYAQTKGLIHKYTNRVLLITTGHCAINCRYCFRRAFPYQAHRQSIHDWKPALDYIASSPQVNEVILSGGEPLLLNTPQLFSLIKRIESMPHIKRIRIHTRLLSTIPARIDDEFIAALKQLSKPLILMTHCNHPNEISPALEQAVNKLKACNVRVFNQSVLLKQVNDHCNTLSALSEKLFDAGIQPYYLFMLDKVKGASHFEVPIQRAKKIYEQLQASISGYMLPKFAIEVPGKPSKTLLTP